MAGPHLTVSVITLNVGDLFQLKGKDYQIGLKKKSKLFCPQETLKIG